MSSWDFIVDNIRFSYSSLSTFETCPYSFKLTYIDKLLREDNFFGEYGTLVHDCFHQYFAKNLEAFELSGYYKHNYKDIVKSLPPPYPAGMAEKYYEQGLEFFNSFSFDIEKYDVLFNEEKIDFEFENGVMFVAKPDLVLLEKETGKYILYDYKTSILFRDTKNGGETTDVKKLDGYHRQMFIYTYALRNHGKFIPVDEITLWFTRPNRKVTIPWNAKKEEATIKWLHKMVKKIREEDEFPYNNTNSYFCDNLCSVRLFCEYK